MNDLGFDSRQDEAINNNLIELLSGRWDHRFRILSLTEILNQELSVKNCLWMRNRLLLLCGLLCISTAALAEGSPFVGRWHWNRLGSTLPPNEIMPEEMIADIVRADLAHVQWSLTVTDKHGKRDVESFDAPANGEFYPISSGMTASFRLDGLLLDATFKGPADESDHLSCRLSVDQKKMTCNGTLSDHDGKTSTYVDVYDRV